MGLPVIATNFSGNTFFMTQNNSILLKIDGMEEITEGAFRGHLWASPSVEHLKEMMRFVCIRAGRLIVSKLVSQMQRYESGGGEKVRKASERRRCGLI